MRFLVRSLLMIALWAGAPVHAAVTITFWSHELGNHFPHAFFTIRGTPDAGGPPVDLNYGFTARSISPAILMGPVRSRLDIASRSYVDGSDAQFSVVATDAQYMALLDLVRDWGDGRMRYSLDEANCIHFTKEAARRLGLTGLDQPRLMRKPRSYLQAVADANPGRVTIVREHGSRYRAALPPLATRLPPPPVVRTVF
jgi:hypothetical protein